MATLHTALALPTDPDLDQLAIGNAEVDAYFRSRQWFSAAKAGPATYQFRDHAGGNVVGYASVGFRNIGRPTDASNDKATYLVVYVAGVHSRFHGQRNPPGGTQTFAASMFETIEGLARMKQGCTGLYLWVRTDNPRAIAFYKKLGFEDDPAGPQQRDSGAPHLTMRKSWT